MTTFWQALFASPLLASSLVAGLLAALACGAVGPLVVARRMLFLAGAVAHIAVGGVGAAIWLRQTCAWPWLTPLHGALVAAVGAALLLAWVQHRVRERLDTLIGALWAVGMAGGLVLVRLTDGYHQELMSYLIGSLSVVGWRDVWLLAGLDALVIAGLLIWHKRLVAVGLDQEHARLQGISPLATDALLLVLVALSVVVLTQVVGLILILALLALPAATAGLWCRRLPAVTLVAILLAMLETLVPRVLVYGSRVSPEAAIVLAAGLVYILALLASSRFSPARPAVGSTPPRPPAKP